MSETLGVLIIVALIAVAAGWGLCFLVIKRGARLSSDPRLEEELRNQIAAQVT